MKIITENLIDLQCKTKIGNAYLWAKRASSNRRNGRASKNLRVIYSCRETRCPLTRSLSLACFPALFASLFISYQYSNLMKSCSRLDSLWTLQCVGPKALILCMNGWDNVSTLVMVVGDKSLQPPTFLWLVGRWKNRISNWGVKLSYSLPLININLF